MDELENYHPLVKSLAFKLTRRLPASIELDDLVQVGLTALYIDGARFDPSLGFAFSTFIMKRINGAMLDHLRAQDFMSRGDRKLSNAIERVRNRMIQNGEVPTAQKLADAVDISTSEFHRLGQPLLVDINGFGKTGLDILDTRADPMSEVQSIRRRDAALAAIDQLSPRLKSIVRMRIIDDLTLREIAKNLGVTESRISQLFADVLLKIEKAVSEH